MTMMCGIVATMWHLHSEAQPDVKAVLYLDTEMPCLRNEALSGRIVIRNNGDADVKLLKSAVNPNDFVYSQLCLFPNVSAHDARDFFIGFEPYHSLRGAPLRDVIKYNVDYEVQRNEDIVTLKKGELLEVSFKDRSLLEIPVIAHDVPDRRVPIAAELYLSPDTWIPVEVHPPISVACDAKSTRITAGEIHRDTTQVYHICIGTNEFLRVYANGADYRLTDLKPDDVVTHSNKVITITQKDGKVRTIPEADIARVSAERAEKKRKARQLETKN